MRAIEITTKDILIKYNLFKAPIQIETVAEKLGIKIEYKELDNSVSGFLVKKDSENIIGLNRFHPNVRKRFTISHEIGHFILHIDKQQLFVDYYKGSMLYRKKNKNDYRDYKIEKEANSFAAAILIPKELLNLELLNLEFNDYEEKLNELASIFQVSEQAMDFRLKNLGLYDYGL